MSVSVTMPRLGESVTEGTITRWLKSEGDHVEADEPLLEVSTDKVDTEVPSPASGVLTSIKVHEDETVEIGVELAVIGGDDAAAPSESEPSEATSTSGNEPETAEPEPSRPQSPSATTPEQGPAAEETGAAEPAERSASAQPADRTPSAPRLTAVPDESSAAGAGNAPRAREAATDNREDAAGTYVTPLVRRLASEHGVDLGTVSGTGIGGRIRKSDVLDAAQRAADGARAEPGRREVAPSPSGTTQPAAVPPAAGAARAGAPVQRGRAEKLSRRRQLIAARMVESLQVSAQLTTVVEVDVTRIARLREAAKRDFETREGVKLSFLPFFASATVEALKVHPVLNASIDTQAGTVTYHDAEHLGIAVDTEGGLTVPVIHNAGDLNLGGLARKIADLAERTRSNKISPDELGGGTFTLTNTGSRGALFDTPIINQPQVGILGTGAVGKRPVVISDDEIGETIAVRSMVYLALSYDHRIVDGADAARFLGTIKQRLEGGSYQRALGLS